MTIFGDNTIEANTKVPSGQAHLNAFVASASGTITKMFLYCTGNTGTATTYVMGMYADSSNPTSRLGVSNPIVIPNGQAAGWIEFDTLSPAPIVVGTTYWIAFAENGGTGGAGVAYATSGGHTSGAGTMSTLPDPFGTPGWNLTNSELYSMYAIIDPPAVGALSPHVPLVFTGRLPAAGSIVTTIMRRKH